MNLIPSKTLNDFITLIENLNIPYSIVGGLAVGVWNKERFTQDMDLTIALDKDSSEQLLTTLKNSPETKIDLIAKDTDSFIPHLIRIHFQDYPIDLITALVPLQDELLARKNTTKLHGRDVYLSTPEDIIALKLIAKRNQDLVDIENILKKFSDLDFAYIEKWAKEWDALDLWKELLKKGQGN